jgi:UDP-N-acetylmuramoyl-tripeptide--D-alanyl-D-alanine ligase
MIVNITTLILVYAAWLVFSGKRLLTYIHALQQEDYDDLRLFKWIGDNFAFDKRLSLFLLVAGGALFLTLKFMPGLFIPPFVANFLVFIGLAVAIYREKDPRKNSKKKLVATTRAKRIFFPALALAGLSGLWCFYMPVHPWIWIFNVQLIPLVLIFVNLLLQPFEQNIQKRYWNEAYEKVKAYEPTVIGITGSFGKTSVKHILGHILKTQAPTLITPGSVNTPMGITRIIREQLEENHRYLVVEMGAYGPGSIERLCKLTPPDMGIITAIGHAHYERFKTLESVAKTKFELAETVLGKDGKMVIHESTLRFRHPEALKDEYPSNFIVCGNVSKNTVQSSNQDISHIAPDDLQIISIKQTLKGIGVDLSWKGENYSLFLPLFGVHHGHNAALAFAAAMELGIPADRIKTALKSLPQIEHRLEVRKQPDGTTLIDDAFNSNPVGFNSALGLLGALGKTGRKILITPGMIELGQAHDQAHEKIGRYAGEICDIAIVVRAERIPAFVEGFKSTGNGKPLHQVASFQDAQSWLHENKQDGDIILIENDLPDIYERVPKI